jgi:hypothetical protein
MLSSFDDPRALCLGTDDRLVAGNVDQRLWLSLDVAKLKVDGS